MRPHNFLRACHKIGPDTIIRNESIYTSPTFSTYEFAVILFLPSIITKRLMIEHISIQPYTFRSLVILLLRENANLDRAITVA